MELLETTWRKILAGEPNAVGFFAAMTLVMVYVVYTMIRRRKGLRSGQVEQEPPL